MARKKVAVNWELLRGAMYRRQSEVAEKLKITQPALSNKLSGRRSLSLDDLNRIAKALDRDTMDFLIEKDAQKKGDDSNSQRCLGGSPSRV